jgi:hypothetical protein
VSITSEQPSSLLNSLRASINRFERIEAAHGKDEGGEIAELFRLGAGDLKSIMTRGERIRQGERTIFDRWDVLACASTYTWEVGTVHETKYFIGANGEFFFCERSAEKRGGHAQELSCERLVLSSCIQHRRNLLQIYRNRTAA